MLGQLDLTKEILIPQKKDGVEGFLVFNPIYMLRGGRTRFKWHFKEGESFMKAEKAGIIVNRGWIPATLRDKRSRLQEFNQKKLVKLHGIFRPGIDKHSYRGVPNSGDNNEWNNIDLNDMGKFWGLSNYYEACHYYFQVVDFGEDRASDFTSPGVHVFDKDETIDSFYGVKISERTNDILFKGFSALTAGFAALGFFCA